MPDDRYRWYRELNSYQWFVLIVAALGWLLDGWLHTRPAFAIVGGLLGGFGGFMSIYYRVQRDIARDKQDRARAQGKGPGV